MGVVSTAIVVTVLLLWVVPLIAGLKLMRGPQRTSGIILTVIGLVWAIPSLLSLVLGAMFLSSARSSFEVKDFDPAKYRGQMGVAHSGYRGECSLTARQRGARETARFVSHDGSFKLPVGLYTVDSFTATATDARGKKWEAKSSWREARELQVSADRPAELTAGPPYEARVTVREPANAPERFDLRVTDRAGNPATISENGSTQRTPPGFQIVNSTGQVLFTGKFAYG